MKTPRQLAVLAAAAAKSADLQTARFENWELREIPDDPDAAKIRARAAAIRAKEPRLPPEPEYDTRPGKYANRVPEVCPDERFRG